MHLDTSIGEGMFGLLSQSATSATVAETPQAEARTAPCHDSYGPTINGRLLADPTNSTRRFETISGKARSCMNGTHKRQ